MLGAVDEFAEGGTGSPGVIIGLFRRYWEVRGTIHDWGDSTNVGRPLLMQEGAPTDSFPCRLKLKESEAAEEPESVSSEKVLKISCNISLAVNYLQQGIMEVHHLQWISSSC